ncbi:hypothetical protein [Zhaonella formicivorans]|uniref:hypothetical protein n=1 Tax=Zhaonella formicivorans TaxID=2528593 RepID=UPI001D12A675|nr:hypothetical protein [Zhaonella formicivorans]
MNSDLEIRLRKAREDKELAEKLQRKLQATEEQLLKSKTRIKELDKLLNKEKRDVEKLEHLSLTNLFVSILGTKEERMDKEQQEYLAAKLKFDAAVSAVKELEKEKQALQEQLVLLEFFWYLSRADYATKNHALMMYQIFLPDAIS